VAVQIGAEALLTEHPLGTIEIVVVRQKAKTTQRE
jgi:hypothetical protein